MTWAATSNRVTQHNETDVYGLWSLLRTGKLSINSQCQGRGKKSKSKSIKGERSSMPVSKALHSISAGFEQVLNYNSMKRTTEDFGLSKALC